MLRLFVLLSGPLMGAAMVAAFGWWTLAATFVACLGLILFSTRNAHEAVTQDAGWLQPSTFMGRL